MTDDLANLAINSATVRQMPLADLIDACAGLGIGAITPWRDKVCDMGVAAAGKRFRDAGVAVSAYCRAGLFAASSPEERQRIAQDNRRAIDEAVEIGAESLVILAGGLPGAGGQTPDRNIANTRAGVLDAMAALLEYAQKAGMPLAIEPLHPMYTADRCCINTLEQALDMCEALNPDGTYALGVAVDVYHLWWDPKLQPQIARAGAGRLLGFHLSDWLVPTTDMLNDRGMIGDGVIDIARIAGWIHAAGYRHRHEIEIFSNRLWAMPGADLLQLCVERYRRLMQDDGQKATKSA